VAARYHFRSSFSLTSDREAVWASLAAVSAWPSWWRSLSSIDVVREATSEGGVGAIHRLHVRAPTGYGFVYSTETTEVDRPRRIDAITSGDIVGEGRFLLADGASGGTDVSFDWLVETPKRWMNLLAPIARPAFTLNHDKVMTEFGRGLAKASGGELTSASNTALKPVSGF
jgi:uncharacterized protein YndB with AHSA1/START domain